MVYPENPFNVHQFNYGNADYDIRNNFTMNYVWSDAFRHITHWGPNALMKGWSFSGTIFRHTGLPFTIYSGTDTNTLQGTNFGSQSNPAVHLCGCVRQPQAISAALRRRPFSFGSWKSLPAGPALRTPIYSTLSTSYGNQQRNQNRGPGYFDTDFAIEKGFGIPKWEGAQFSIGARFFNLFNHPNFYFPVMNVAKFVVRHDCPDCPHPDRYLRIWAGCGQFDKSDSDAGQVPVLTV